MCGLAGCRVAWGWIRGGQYYCSTSTRIPCFSCVGRKYVSHPKPLSLTAASGLVVGAADASIATSTVATSPLAFARAAFATSSVATTSVAATSVAITATSVAITASSVAIAASAFTLATTAVAITAASHAATTVTTATLTTTVSTTAFATTLPAAATRGATAAAAGSAALPRWLLQWLFRLRHLPAGIILPRRPGRQPPLPRRHIRSLDRPHKKRRVRAC